MKIEKDDEYTYLFGAVNNPEIMNRIRKIKKNIPKYFSSVDLSDFGIVSLTPYEAHNILYYIHFLEQYVDYLEHINKNGTPVTDVVQEEENADL